MRRPSLSWKVVFPYVNQVLDASARSRAFLISKIGTFCIDRHSLAWFLLP
ncbi:unnamed protein product [Amoebophrya sp. A25]|nr:unnamed protein product [Amoebophrya sp. A25]|eukprot:GSA25T00001588001.1